MKRFYLLSVISLFSAGISAQEITGGERTLSADSTITSDARLDSIYQSLPEVMITGERPVVKASCMTCRGLSATCLWTMPTMP